MIGRRGVRLKRLSRLAMAQLNAALNSLGSLRPEGPPVRNGCPRMSKGQNDRTRHFSSFALFVILAIAATVALCVVAIIKTAGAVQ